MNGQYFSVQESLKEIVLYMKMDLETCLNVVYVLAASETQLQNILETLNIRKEEIVAYMRHILKQEIKRQVDQMEKGIFVRGNYQPMNKYIGYQ